MTDKNRSVKFSKRHYEVIAKILRGGHVRISEEPGETITYMSAGRFAEIYDLAREFAEEFERDNPLFSRSRFLNACGVPDNETRED
jgi:hypothetical protein